jgi:ATP-dependent Lon protease
MRPEFFTNQYGLIVDYLAEYLREMRKHSFADASSISGSSWATT